MFVKVDYIDLDETNAEFSSASDLIMFIKNDVEKSISQKKKHINSQKNAGN
jgi:hypothetical protein